MVVGFLLFQRRRVYSPIIGVCHNSHLIPADSGKGHLAVKVFMKIVLAVLSALLIISSFIPAIKGEAWWIRIFDFPQLQIAFLVIICLVIYSIGIRKKRLYDYLLIIGLTASLGYLSYRIYPYTIFAKPQVLMADKKDPDNTISIISANVFQKNRQADKLLELLPKYQPDVLLLLETNQWWVDQMKGLESDYPYHRTIPLENTYGMALYSKLPLSQVEIKYVIQEDVPSIHGMISLSEGTLVKFHCLHPKPPTPSEESSSAPRDAELMIIAKSSGFNDRPTIVIGDLNDVAWSHTTRLFQRVSRLLDPRIGRGFYNTFNADMPMLRWPLDHIFHSNDFKLVGFERLPDIGSDHFPIFVKLQYDTDAEHQQPEPQPESEDNQEASEKIEEGSKEN